eukprot:TRINITY_DN4180_c0_g1_i1.p1 TRINITY_DN4180_c0_g1~~TRINITY_DN4180_c0_g1_i1.p1  ORF type:complete len:239 (-),score=46.05 TRINITY_DN4180_c0_g1_i1:259-909(-)
MSRFTASRFTGFLREKIQYGRWVPEPVIIAKGVAGGLTLDFSQAIFVHPVITIKVTAYAGGVTLIVPPNVHVEQKGHAVLGAFGGGGGVFFRRNCALSETVSNSGITIKIEGRAFMGAVNAAVNRNAAPAQLVTLEEAARIIREVPEQPSTTREDMRQQIIDDALSRRLASAPPEASAALQHAMMNQGQNPTLLQSRKVVEGVPVPCKESCDQQPL